MAKDNDLVTITEASRALGVTSNALFMSIKRGVSGFPRPQIEGRSTKLYSMRDVAEWARKYYR